jgi:hypothetical protein
MLNDTNDESAVLRLSITPTVEASASDETQASAALKTFAESAKAVAQATLTLATWLGGIAEVFNNTLGPAMRRQAF